MHGIRIDFQGVFQPWLIWTEMQKANLIVKNGEKNCVCTPLWGSLMAVSQMPMARLFYRKAVQKVSEEIAFGNSNGCRILMVGNF